MDINESNFQEGRAHDPAVYCDGSLLLVFFRIGLEISVGVENYKYYWGDSLGKKLTWSGFLWKSRVDIFQIVAKLSISEL